MWFTITGTNEIGSVSADENDGEFTAALDVRSAFASWPDAGHEFWVNAYDTAGHADRVKFRIIR
nr:hypothetical protein [uncultured Actinoplanes sp.]